ncbi:Avirulence (Avh) protein [Phytophthora cinnamomi]|uniref:Avirulence (Avh) protein n=1 Tax=Phytophthora cinnamomi TaxID=4785 RepID=UPI00355AB227|nr:Avirulence (Avh) protein [Phytophthora cinnamomi]
MAWLLWKAEPSYDTISKMGVHPDQVFHWSSRAWNFQALGLKKAMLHACDYRHWAAVKQSAECINYQQFWNTMNRAA